MPAPINGLDDLNRAAARLDRAAQLAGVAVALIMAALVGAAVLVAALLAVMWHVLDRVGAPV